MRDPVHVVVVTAVDECRLAVARLAALAGAVVEPVMDSAAVRSRWSPAAAVVVGADLAPIVAAAGLPRRPDVVLVTLSGMDPELADPALWRTAVEIGASRVVAVPEDERILVELLTDVVDASTTSGCAASAIGVLGGCGGAGASTLAAATAVTAAASVPTALIDMDPIGGGLDVLLGLEQQPGSRWPELVGTRGRLGAATLRDALVRSGSLSLLSSGRDSGGVPSVEAVGAVLDAAVRGHRAVVIDLPRCLHPPAALAASAVDLLVLVVPATVRAAAAAAGVLAALPGGVGPVRLVVRDPGGGRLTAAEIGDALGRPVLATLRSEQSVVAAASRGDPPLRRKHGSLAEVSRGLVAAAAEPGGRG
jgi:secretion/DNA translocation related CpaE-like protein